MAAQQREVAGAGAAEAEVLADQHPARAEAAHEHVVDEQVGIERGERTVEASDVDAFDAERPKRLQLAAQAGEPRRRALLREEFARVRIEREHSGHEPQVVGRLLEPREHRLVPAMDTVEVPDGQRDRPVGDRGQAAEETHVTRGAARSPRGGA